MYSMNYSEPRPRLCLIHKVKIKYSMTLTISAFAMPRCDTTTVRPAYYVIVSTDTENGKLLSAHFEQNMINTGNQLTSRTSPHFVSVMTVILISIFCTNINIKNKKYFFQKMKNIFFLLVHCSKRRFFMLA